MTSCEDYLDKAAKKLCVTDENYKKAEKANQQMNQSVASLFEDQ